MKDQLETLIGAERSGRSESYARRLREVRDEYTRRGALGYGRFPVDLDLVAGEELELRAQRYIEIVERSATRTAWVWSADSAREIAELLAAELSRDWTQIQEKERAFSAAHEIQIVALNAALERARVRLDAGLQLRVQAQVRTAVPLLERLSAPRYEATRRLWERARLAFPRPSEDPALAVRDATGAVEELARVVLGKPKIVLGDSIPELRKRKELHPVALKGLTELWAIRSDVPGLGHGASADPLDVATARYLLDIAEAALRLLIELDAG